MTHVTPETPTKGRTMTAIDPAKALAEARTLWMAEHGVSGIEGIKRADAALKVTEPWLFTAYAAKLSEGAKK